MTAAHAEAQARHPHWHRFARMAGIAFLLFVAALIVRYAQRVDWDDVWLSLRALPPAVLAAAALLAACSHAMYSCFDLFGRRYTGHRIAAPSVMKIAWISYAFNLNMGSTVGGVGMRLRLYSHWRIGPLTVAKILTISMLTNWLGDMALAGVLFTFVPLELPPNWKLDSDGLSLLGVALLTVVLTYLAMCAWARKRSWTVRGHVIDLPPIRMALLQVALSACNWATIAAVPWVLLQGRVDYSAVLSVLLMAAMAGLIVRVPAGLGVLEAVFLGLLSHRVPEGQLLAALFAYRGIYYIAPLALAALVYAATEAKFRALHRAPESPPKAQNDPS